MNRVLTTVLAVALLLGLGGLAVLALPGASAPLAAAPFVSAAAPPAQDQPESVTAPEVVPVSEAWNNISVPLTVSGVTTADGVAAYINAHAIPDTAADSVVKVAKWDATYQSLVIRDVGSLFGEPDFGVQTGDWLMVAVNANSATDFTFGWVGDVPDKGYRSYQIVANGWSSIMLPLETDTTTVLMGDDLAGEIGNPGDVIQVAKWDAAYQSLVIRDVGSLFGEPDFSVNIGYPYMVYSTALTTWP